MTEEANGETAVKRNSIDNKDAHHLAEVVDTVVADEVEVEVEVVTEIEVEVPIAVPELEVKELEAAATLVALTHVPTVDVLEDTLAEREALVLQLDPQELQDVQQEDTPEDALQLVQQDQQDLPRVALLATEASLLHHVDETAQVLQDEERNEKKVSDQRSSTVEWVYRIKMNISRVIARDVFVLWKEKIPQHDDCRKALGPNRRNCPKPFVLRSRNIIIGMKMYWGFVMRALKSNEKE